MGNSWKSYWSSTDTRVFEKLIQRYKSKKGYAKLLKAIPEIEGDYKTLEVGAGKAWLSRILRARGCHTMAIDIEPSVAETSKHFVDSYVVGDMFHLPFEDNSFDLVLSCGLIEHFTLSEVNLIIKEMARVGKSVAAWYPTCGLEWKAMWFLRNLFGGNVVTHTFKYSTSEICDIFSSVGLSSLRSKTTSFAGIFRYLCVHGVR